MALESGRAPALVQARVLRPLAAFGLIHGTHELLESYLMQAEAFGTTLPGWLPWLRLGFLFASFTSLFLYGFQMLLLVSPYNHEKRTFLLSAFAVYALFIIINIIRAYIGAPIPFIHLLDGLGRYLLAVPAAMLAALALRAQAREMHQNNHMRLSKSLSIASFGFAIYTLTQLFVHPIDMFPARYINEELILASTGFPIQLIRTLMAILITYGLLRATQFMEVERQTQLFAAQQARLEALEQQEEIRCKHLRHIVQVQEDERALIARELHDETSQTLSAFTLELASLRVHAKRNSKVKSTLDRLQNLNHQMLDGIHNLVHDLRPAQLDDLGLVPAMQSLFESDSYSLGTKVIFEVSGTKRRLDPLIETVLFRAAQESLNNVNRHAEINEVTVRLDFASDEVTLGVLDAGKGFDSTEQWLPPRGWGLAGMRERVELVGGQLNLYSAPERGTSVEVVIPIEKGD